MQIRKATTKDISVITDHNILLALESEDEVLNPTIVKQGVKSLLSHPEKGFYLVAEQENAIIGQLMITFEWSDWRNIDIWWIQSVYISKKYRKKGIFTALFDEIKKRAEKEHIPLLRLYVHKENTAAQYVYEKRKMIKGTYLFYEIPVEKP